MRLITLFLTVIIVLDVLYCAFYIIGVFKQGYSWQEMDWNQDGSTSIGEVFAAADSRVCISFNDAHTMR